MNRTSLKQKVLTGIEELPANASIDDIIFKVYQLHINEISLITSRFETHLEYDQLITKVSEN